MNQEDFSNSSATNEVIDSLVSEESAQLPRRIYPSIWQSVGIVFLVLLISLLSGIGMFFARSLGIEIAFLICYVSGMGLSFLAIHTIRKRRQDDSYYQFRLGSWRQILPLILGTVGLMFGVIGPISTLIPIPDAIWESTKHMMLQTGLPTFLYLVVAAPILEELIFRGIMLDGLLRRYRPNVAILVSSTLFGVVHLNPWQFVTGFILGLYLGWVYYRSGSVGACIVIHMAANLSAYLVRLLYDFSTMQAPEGVLDSYGGMTPLLVATTFWTIIIGLSISYLHREFNRLDGQLQAAAAEGEAESITPAPV